MEIYVRVKALGKRKDILAPTAYPTPMVFTPSGSFLRQLCKKR